MTPRLDRLISAISPSWAMSRAIARHDLQAVQNYSMSAYSSGDTWNRQRKHAAFGRSNAATEETATGAFGYDAMRLEAMDLYRNNPLARALVETTRRYARQSRPRACTASILEAEGATQQKVEGAKVWDARATDYFCGYHWNRADALRRPGVTFGTQQDTFITLQFVQGDLGYVHTKNGWLSVEGIQIRTPSALVKDDNIRHGFRFNAKGQITHIYVCGWDKYGSIDDRNYSRFPISSVIFCPWYWRSAQNRAVPRLHGAIDALRDDDEIHDSVKLKVKHEAMLLSVEKAGSRKKAPGSKITNNDGTETTYERAEYGMRFRTTGKPGDDFQFANGTSPNAQYVPLMEHDAMRISAAVGIPYKILMSLYDGSWSSNKAAQTALKVFVTEIWTHRRDVFTQRAYNIVIADAIRAGHIDPAPVDNRGVSLFSRAEWTRPYFPQLDQQKEEQGRTLGFRNMTTGFDDWADEQGTSADAMFRNHKKSIQRLKQDAEDLDVPFELYAAGLLTGSSSISASASEEDVPMETEEGQEGNKWLT